MNFLPKNLNKIKSGKHFIVSALSLSLLLCPFKPPASVSGTASLNGIASAENGPEIKSYAYPAEIMDGDNIAVSNLPAMPGKVAIIFQAKNLLKGDLLTFKANKIAIGNITVTADQSDYGGPLHSSGRTGVFRLVAESQNWPDNDSSVKLEITRQSSSSAAVPMQIRWLLAQSDRIGMTASFVGVAPFLNGTRQNWGGTYAFINANAESVEDAVWALEQDYVAGVSLALWWKDIKPKKNTTIAEYENSETHGIMKRILKKAEEKGKRVNLYIRGITSATLKEGVNCEDTDASQAGAPSWALNYWRDRGHIVSDVTSHRKALDDNVRRCWLEISDDGSELEDLKQLIVASDNPAAEPAVYDIINTVYGSEPVIGFISVPSLSIGHDPGQFSWAGLAKDDCSKLENNQEKKKCRLEADPFKEYLKRHFNSDILSWKAWAETQAPSYLGPQLNMIKNSSNPDRYGIISNTMFNFNYYEEPGWYDDFYKALVEDSQQKTGGRMILATYSLEGSQSDTKGINCAIAPELTGCQILSDSGYNRKKPSLPARSWWNFVAASRKGIVTWAQSSSTLLSGSSDQEDLKLLADAYNNAFNAGVRNYEIWNSQMKRVNGQNNSLKSEFLAKIRHYNILFSFRNRLADACNIADFSSFVPVLSCSDGTQYSQCSANKPQYCDNGTLINKCSSCGCPAGQSCGSDNSCSVIGGGGGGGGTGGGGGGGYIPPSTTGGSLIPPDYTNPQTGVLGDKIFSYPQYKSLYELDSKLADQIAFSEAVALTSYGQFTPLDNNAGAAYEWVMARNKINFDLNQKYALAYYIQVGTPTTKRLGSGERKGVLGSFFSAYGYFPVSLNDWKDTIKIASGRWPEKRDAGAEQSADQLFNKIYLRFPRADKPEDQNARMIIAYGLRPVKRDLYKEINAISIFKQIFKRSFRDDRDWNTIRVIAYSGAKR
jgi:hypothetical protein